MVVPGEFCLCWASADGNLSPLAGSAAPKVACVEAGDDSLLVFYVTSMEAIRQYTAPALNLADYFQAAGVDLQVRFVDPA